MHENDLELKLSRGKPIPVDSLGYLYPLTLDEISEIGEYKYNQYIFSTNLKKENFGLENEEITQFELTFLYCRQDESFRKMFLDSFSCFFRERVYYHENGFFYLGIPEENMVIGLDKFDEILKIIKKQNFVNDKEKEEEFNPADERTKELIDKLKYFRQLVKEQNQEKGLNLNDITQIVAAHSPNINIFNVWDLTVYQLYTLYIRLMMKENFGLEYAKYVQGGDPKDLKLDHWASKIQN